VGVVVVVMFIKIESSKKNNGRTFLIIIRLMFLDSVYLRVVLIIVDKLF